MKPEFEKCNTEALRIINEVRELSEAMQKGFYSDFTNVFSLWTMRNEGGMWKHYKTWQDCLKDCEEAFLEEILEANDNEHYQRLPVDVGNQVIQYLEDWSSEDITPLLKRREGIMTSLNYQVGESAYKIIKNANLAELKASFRTAGVKKEGLKGMKRDELEKYIENHLNYFNCKILAEHIIFNRARREP